MNVSIRHEEYKDISKIAELTGLAFENSNPMNEVVLIDALRHRKEFDPELSLVAEYEGEIIGHILFSPVQTKMNQAYLKGAILAPLAVHPNYQKKGIGSMLIQEGHKRLKDKGYQLSMLLGHPNYYPKFGYETKMFGESKVNINSRDLNGLSNPVGLIERNVIEQDIVKLSELWEDLFADTDIANRPGDTFTDWISCGKGITSSVLELNNEIIGYIRYETEHRERIQSLLFKPDGQSLNMILAYITEKLEEMIERISLPLHPNSNLVKDCLGVPYEVEENIWEAAMICQVNQNNDDIRQYIEQVKNKKRKPGLVTWPIEFDVC